jgi:hypothetical protein
MRQEVIASLEGARIVISDGTCQLDEYNFEVNCWNLKEQFAWPLSREQGFKALNLLVRPEPD